MKKSWFSAQEPTWQTQNQAIRFTYLGRANLEAVHGEYQNSRATIIHVGTQSFSFPEPLTLGRNTAQIYWVRKCIPHTETENVFHT